MNKTMKRIVILFVMLAASCQLTFAQGKEDWREKIMSEKIAFLTTELSITPQEAQLFWPVYNQVQKEKDTAMHQVFRSYKALSAALKENKPAKEIDKLLTDYLDASEKQRDVESKASEKFKKILPVDKVARLYIAEEKFRRQQIHRLHSNHQKPSGRTH